MGKEIEKKFLFKEDGINYVTPPFYSLYNSLNNLEKQVRENGSPIFQGYLPIEKGMELAKELDIKINFEPTEIRLRDKAEKFYVTIKGNGDVCRNEVEKGIEKIIFDKYWDLTLGKRVEKIRLEKPYNNFKIEIDVYTDRNLILAEIEVPSIEIADALIPLGKDVTSNPQYKNRNLAK